MHALSFFLPFKSLKCQEQSNTAGCLLAQLVEHLPCVRRLSPSANILLRQTAAEKTRCKTGRVSAYTEWLCDVCRICRFMIICIYFPCVVLSLHGTQKKQSQILFILLCFLACASKYFMEFVLVALAVNWFHHIFHPHRRLLSVRNNWSFVTTHAFTQQSDKVTIGLSQISVYECLTTWNKDRLAVQGYVCSPCVSFFQSSTLIKLKGKKEHNK